MEIVRNVQSEAVFSQSKVFIKESWSYLYLKRFIDIVGSFAGLILLSPLFLIVSILIKIEDLKAPIFFKQVRIGKNGNHFHIYKFRSMMSNAEERLKRDKRLYEKYLKNNYKLEQDEDPRITRLGRTLRRTSLDEIPQLINVLKGEMSLVGPRPIVQDEIEEYKNKKDEFLSVKPGMTGYWQISGRSEINYPERCDLELYYVHNKSLWFDIEILFKTVIIVILKRVHIKLIC
ncbi:sugar transferase [Tepidibacillus marianensis]|uniref:sugar transferase n=1 Tax=Tepidibacillus marianensis TaxID=3131995 RepID=UPI0030CC118A